MLKIIILILLMILLILLQTQAFRLDQGSMDGFLTFQEIHDFLDYHLETFPNLVELAYFGQSSQIRDIRGLKITDSAYQGEKSVVVISASQTSGFPISTSAALYSIQTLLNNSDFAFFNYLMKSREIYVLPLMNPDAYALTEKYFKHGQGFKHYETNRNSTGCTSLEGNGVMLNRNWGFKWNSTGDSSADPCSDRYPGPSAFSEIETRSVRDYFNASQVLAWLHYEGPGNRYTFPFTSQKKQKLSARTSFIYSVIQKKMQPDWTFDSLFRTSNETEDGTLIDYYQNLGTLSLEAAVGSQLVNQSQILDVLEEHFQVALKMIELAGSYLNYIDFRSVYKDCGKKCGKKSSKAHFEFLFENLGLADSPKGVLTIVVNSEFIFDDILKILTFKVEFQEIFEGGKTGIVDLQDSFLNSDTVFYVEGVSIPALTRARFMVEIAVNGTFKNGVDVLASLKYEFGDDIHPDFSVNGVLRKSELSSKPDGNFILPVVLSVSLAFVVFVFSFVLYLRCKRKIYEKTPSVDLTFNKTIQ